MAITFGLDISHHQPLSLDLAAARRDGCELCLLKAGEGSSYVDPTFAANLAEARAAGMLTAAYWYIKASASAQAHVDAIKKAVPKAVPIIPDVEANSGGVALVRDIVNRLRAEGYIVPLLYLPRWYWQQLGSPSLAGLPPLWSSRYPDNVVGLLAAEWARVPASYWDGYGGLDVALLQFTSSAKIADYSPLDANAFRGTRDELAALLGAASGGGAVGSAVTPKSKGETDMIRVPKGGSADKPVSFPLAMSMLFDHDVIIAPGKLPVVLYEVYNWGWTGDDDKDMPGTGGNPLEGGKTQVIQVKGSWSFIVPAKTGKCDLLYWADDDFTVAVERRV